MNARRPDPAEELEQFRQSPYAPVRWLVDEDFWQKIAINLYSAAVIAIFTITTISSSKIIREGNPNDIGFPIFAGVFAILAPPLLVLITHLFHLQKTGKDEKSTFFTAMMIVNLLMSLGAIGAVIVYGVTNIQTN